MCNAFINTNLIKIFIQMQDFLKKFNKCIRDYYYTHILSFL
jgi:hypothetical protein